MLNIEAQKRALKLLGYTDEQVAAVFADKKEKDLTVPEGLTVLDAAGMEQLKTNLKNGVSKDYPEIWCRKMNKDYELGLTGDDAKDETKVLAALKAKAVKEAGVTPTEWEDKFKTLQTTVDKKDGEVLTVKQQLEALQSEKKYRKLFWGDMSDALDEDEWIARLQRSFTIKKEGDIEGLFDNATGKFVTDEKLNVIPYTEAWATLRTSDKYKSWHKAKSEPAPAREPRQSHDPKTRNPALPNVKKYTKESAMAEVEKQYPADKKNTTQGWAKLRNQLFNALMAQNA